MELVRVVERRIEDLQRLVEELNSHEVGNLTSAQRKWIREIQAGDMLEDLQGRIAEWVLVGDENCLEDVVTMLRMLKK